MDVSVRELKAHLSNYLRRVREGEEIVVISRGRRIARLVAEPEVSAIAESDVEIVARIDRELEAVPPASRGVPQGAAHPIRAGEGERLSAKLLDRD